MEQYFGIAERELYTLFNYIGTAIVFLYNFAHFREKRKNLSNCCNHIIKSIPDKKSLTLFRNPYFWVIAETALISVNQYMYGGIFNVGFGDLVGTDANYFGLLFFAPIPLFMTMLVLSPNPLKQLDLITPAYPLALVSSKIACYVAGCCTGMESVYGLYNHNTQQTEIPIQLIESALALLVFFVIILIRKKVKKEGTLYPTYIIIYSAVRFFSEFLRSEENIFFGLKLYHILCIIGIFVGLIEIKFINKNKDKIIRLYDKSFYVIADFFYVVTSGFELKKEKKVKQNKKKRNKNRKPSERQPLSDVTFDFSKVKIWVLVWVVGLIGQIGWSVEGSWFNTFVYEKIDKDPSIITPMLIFSSMATAISIFVLGTLSDRTGKRRNLINVGYIVWGSLLMFFGLTQFLARSLLSFAVLAIVIADMFISFFASAGTDVGFNIWLTDIINDKNRGQIGAAIAVQSVLGPLLGTIIGGIIIGQSNNYIKLFFIMGLFLIAGGIISSYLFSKKDDVVPIIKGTFKEQLTIAFDYKSFFRHKELLWIHASVTVFFIGFNIYYPHLGNYLLDYLGFAPNKVGVIATLPLVLAMLLSIPTSKHINNNKFFEITLVSVISGLFGVFLIYPLTPETVNTERILNVRLLLAIFLIGVSYITMLQATKVWTKKLYPPESKGQYEVFYALAFGFIPITFAATIGERLVKYTGLVRFDELTQRNEYIPTGNIFIVGAIVSAFTLIPILITKYYTVKNSKKSSETE